jgi:BirA family biotin operon repressor/biotin-[acetyl-CoA-carboxylase] ligase
MLEFLNAFDAPVFYKQRTRSTMEDARALIAPGCRHGTVALAGYQEAGRGRLKNRRWEAEESKNLLFSILLKKEHLPSGGALLPLTAGLAVSEAVEKLYSIETRIKWPNDVWRGKRKICGILCEGVGAFVIAGIGINCNQAAFPAELVSRAVSLREITGAPVDIRILAEEVLSRLKALIRTDNVIALVEERLLFRGEEVTFSTGNREKEEMVTGLCCGIGVEGELILQRSDTGEQLHLFGGELVLP